MAANPLRATLATTGEQRAALRARLAAEGGEVLVDPGEPAGDPHPPPDPPTPPPAPPVITQGARKGRRLGVPHVGAEFRPESSAMWRLRLAVPGCGPGV